jgi:hypothetical protein
VAALTARVEAPAGTTLIRGELGRVDADIRIVEAPKGPPQLTLGTIQDRLGFNIHADFLTRLGFPCVLVRNSKLYHSEDFGRLCAKLAEHVLAVGESMT